MDHTLPKIISHRQTTPKVEQLAPGSAPHVPPSVHIYDTSELISGVLSYKRSLLFPNHKGSLCLPTSEENASVGNRRCSSKFRPCSRAQQ